MMYGLKNNIYWVKDIAGEKFSRMPESSYRNTYGVTDPEMFRVRYAIWATL